MFDEPLAIRREDAVLVLEGNLDEFALGDLRTALDDLLATAPKAVVDVSGVEFLPSAGVGVLVQARSQARRSGASLALVAGDGTPSQRTLEMMGVPFVATRDDAQDPGSALSN